jgi:hypothetical protein
LRKLRKSKKNKIKLIESLKKEQIMKVNHIWN